MSGPDKLPEKQRFPEEHRAATRELLAETLHAGSGTRLTVRGQCMEPLIFDGDEIAVAPLTSPPRIGDLVLAHTDAGEIVCHRVVRENAEAYWLAGDRTLRLDRHPKASVLGRVTAVHRGDESLPISPAGPLIRLQVRLHHLVRRRPDAWWIRCVEWPRRLIIELGGLRRGLNRRS